ncbi:hypothetical protein VMCG_04727 [Cytospora schulzeri]|uniref:Uncharacterized protein n=1 Tax=Cytospora schulzeri TaxID=448051 RepID=A0A423WN62_9PEZI|nr:hypothetical protein VMCG_04727 [Valsa malicola]
MFRLSSLTVHAGRSRTYNRLFSTTRALSSGSFFNLGGLGASREAQYLSKEHGIPRTEYSSNIHLIRSSEVDPFAPVPGASPSVAAARATQDVAQSNVKFFQAATTDKLVLQLRAATEELAQTKRALTRLQVRNKGLETAIILVPILFSAMAFIGYQVYGEREGGIVEPWQRLSNTLGLHFQQPVSETHGSTQPYRDATVEEHALAVSGMTSVETRSQTATDTTRSNFPGLFWARN